MSRTTKRERRFGKTVKSVDHYDGEGNTFSDYKQKAKAVMKHNRRELNRSLKDELQHL